MVDNTNMGCMGCMKPWSGLSSSVWIGWCERMRVWGVWVYTG